MLRWFLACRPRAEPMAFVAGLKIYDPLEMAVDRFEGAANRISGALIEHF
jgi:uncharacterized protein Yka (UPF0111/DUF47 family)